MKFSLRVVPGHIIKFQSCDNDVGDVGEVEHEERVDKNWTTRSTNFYA